MEGAEAETEARAGNGESETQNEREEHDSVREGNGEGGQFQNVANERRELESISGEFLSNGQLIGIEVGVSGRCPHCHCWWICITSSIGG